MTKSRILRLNRVVICLYLESSPLSDFLLPKKLASRGGIGCCFTYSICLARSRNSSSRCFRRFSPVSGGSPLSPQQYFNVTRSKAELPTKARSNPTIIIQAELDIQTVYIPVFNRTTPSENIAIGDNQLRIVKFCKAHQSIFITL